MKSIFYYFHYKVFIYFDPFIFRFFFHQNAHNIRNSFLLASRRSFYLKVLWKCHCKRFKGLIIIEILIIIRRYSINSLKRITITFGYELNLTSWKIFSIISITKWLSISILLSFTFLFRRNAHNFVIPFSWQVEDTRYI